MAIAAYFVFQREISRSVFWDFFDSIDPNRTFKTGDRRKRGPGKSMNLSQSDLDQLAVAKNLLP
jgi:hypothetical protein